MIVLQAPHTLIQTTTLLPDPDYEDSEALDVGIIIKNAMDGTDYTYIKSSLNRILSYSLYLKRSKQLELEAFIKAYYGEDIRLTNHKEEVWVVKIMNELIDFEILNKGERVQIVLQFHGLRLV